MSDLETRLIALHRAEPSRARTVAAERLVRRIENEGPEHLLPSAYELMVHSYVFGHEPRKAFVPFARWVRLHDTRPEIFDRGDLESLLWAFRWMGLRASDYPDIPFEQVEATLDDMERRYVEAGWDMDAVRLDRYLWSWFRDAPDTEKLYWEWVHEPRTEISDCAAACDASGEAEYLRATGRYEEAAARVEKALADGRFCSSEPGVMLLVLAEAYLDLGRGEDAVHAFRRVVRFFAQGANGEQAYPRGKIIRFLARAGHPELTVLRIQAEQKLLTDAQDPSAQAYFLLHVAGAARMAALTQPELPVRLDKVPVSTVAELARWAEAGARDLAAAFDRRNRCDALTRELERELALQPVAEPLPLEVVPREWEDEELPDGVAAAPVDGAAAVDAASAAEGGAVAPAAEGATDGDAPMSREEIEELHAEAVKFVKQGQVEQATLLFQRVNDAARTAGYFYRVGTSAGNLGLIARLSGDLPGADRAMRQSLAYMRAGGGVPGRLSFGARMWVPVACELGQPEPALAELRSTRAEVEQQLTSIESGDDSAKIEAPVPKDREYLDATRLRKELLESRDTEARALATLGHHDEAARLAVEAARAFADHGLVVDAVHSLALAARAYVSAGRDEDAIEPFEFALEGLEQVRNRKLRAVIVTELADALRRLGRTEEADEHEAALLRA